MFKHLLPMLFMNWLLKFAVVEAIVLGIVYIINLIFGISISYLLVGGVVAVLFVLGFITSLVAYRNGKKVINNMADKFDDDFFKGL